MQDISELKPTDRNYVAIRNAIKIRNWVKQNIPAECIDDLYRNGARGEFSVNGYDYSWSIHDTLGIAMRVGYSTLTSYNDPHKGSGCGDYDFKDGEGFYYSYSPTHFGVFVDHWGEIKRTILGTLERVKSRTEFEP